MRFFALSFVGIAALCACSTSDETPGANAADATAEGAAPGCESFTKVGDPCGVDVKEVCFRECKTDGCTCKNGAWACTRDFSCMPVDAGVDAIIFQDAAVEDAPVDAPVDVAADAPSDAPSDAPADAPTDG